MRAISGWKAFSPLLPAAGAAPGGGPCPPVLRFAPSPNGLLHRGHAFSALLNRHLAHSWGGRFLLRIEDIDVARCSDSLAAAAIEDLRWLGLDWCGEVRRQSRHFADYAAAAMQLRAQGLLYQCYASRAEIAAAADGLHDPDGAPLRRRDIPVLTRREEERRELAGAPFALRLDMRRALAVVAAHAEDLAFPALSETAAVERRIAEPARWGDVVLVRKDVPASYHLAVVVDDALQGITHVIRGRDLEAATDIHRLLQALLGLPVPVYHHHALIQDEGGDKLAKSRGSLSLRALRESGVRAADLRAEFGLDREGADTVEKDGTG
ncbi:MAG: tRNA glutamyl-Q(34) synthetase GluQRS [Pseudochelatococcus sp.]|jgi:glutamyl-Q tRNA(Asp) synthetase|uniref:tRNA glutamyl-Q(34) synthetase GluQRS n=1 Tax=Pseudochelatococcus sp. TaxID=2020869 RepID=UPI003D8D173A